MAVRGMTARVAVRGAAVRGTAARGVAACAVAAALVAPSAAQGAEAHVEAGPDGGRMIVFTAAAGERNSVLVDRDPGFTDDLYQLEDQDNPVTSGPGCANKPRTPFSGTEPDIVRCETAGVTTIKVVLGDQVDSTRFGDLNGNVIVDAIEGGTGIDRIGASSGRSVITGGDGEDQIDGRAGDDQISGGTGNDEITAGQGSDTVAGDKGNDIIRGYALPGTQEIGIVTKYRGGEVNRLGGGPGNDRLEGDNGPDQISGGPGNDGLHGGGDGDVMRGDAGNDTIDEGDTAGAATSESVGAPIAADVIHGGSGKDTATYCTRRGATPLKISLDRKANDGRKGERDNIGPKGDVENVLGGGESSDTIRGNGSANVLSGDCLTTVAKSGNNKIFGLGGADRVVGGDGRDLLNGGSGPDRFIGNEDRDTIQARDGGRDKSINCDGLGVESGSDRATVDRSDPPARSCEKVSRG
jgi:Ca2+-binding RTX toxin-like protein